MTAVQADGRSVALHAVDLISAVALYQFASLTAMESGGPLSCVQVAAEADVLYQTRIQKERFQARRLMHASVHYVLVCNMTHPCFVMHSASGQTVKAAFSAGPTRGL